MKPITERSAIEILLDYPREKGLPFETHENEKRFHLNPSDPSLKSRYVYFREGRIIFFAYDSYALKAGSSTTFSGIYTEFIPDDTAEFSIYKKDWVHRFLLRNKVKSGIKGVDQQLTIVSKNNHKGINTETANHFLELEQEIHPLKLQVRNDYLPLIPDFKGKNIIGLETNQWLYKNEDLSLLIDKGSKLLANFT